MQFGSPLTAGAGSGAIAPGALIATLSCATTTTFPSATTAYDVSAFQSILLIQRVAPLGGGNVLNVSPNFFDAAGVVSGQPLGGLGATFDRTIHATLVAYSLMYANSGPFLRVTITNTGAAWTTPCQWALYGINRPARFDGPYSPTLSGLILFSKTDNLAAGAFALTNVGVPYCGPAYYYVRSTSTQGAGSGILQAGGTDFAGTAAPLTTSAFPSTIPLWIPPQGIQSIVTNLSINGPFDFHSALVAA